MPHHVRFAVSVQDKPEFPVHKMDVQVIERLPQYFDQYRIQGHIWGRVFGMKNLKAAVTFQYADVEIDIRVTTRNYGRLLTQDGTVIF
jgi:hypothetical protein